MASSTSQTGHDRENSSKVRPSASCSTDTGLGPCSDRTRGTPREVIEVLCCSVAFALPWTLSGCGGLPDGDKQLASQSVSRPAEAPRDTSVTPEVLAKTPPGSAQEALLTYWRDVQSARYQAASNRFSRRLRAVVTDHLIIEALRSNSGVYRASRPTIVSIDRGAARSVTVRFIARTAASPAQAAPSALRLRKQAGRWRITFSAPLNAELGAAAARAAQFAEKPNSEKIGQRGLAASRSASQIPNRLFEADRASGQNQ